MNIIIVGAGEIGRHLASVLSQEAHNISVIEKDAALASELEQAIDRQLADQHGFLSRTITAVELQLSAEVNPYVDALIDEFDRRFAIRHGGGGGGSTT